MRTEEVAVSVREEFAPGAKHPDGRVNTSDKTVVWSVEKSKIQVPIYETLAEAVQHETEGVVLSRFNSQNKTDLMNEERTKYNSKPSKSYLESQVFAKKMITDAEWDEIRQDPAKLTSIRDKYVAQLQSEWEAARASGGAASNE